MWQVIQTDKPSRLIINISCRIEWAHSIGQLCEILMRSGMKHVRVQYKG
jgi:hypothetical protein